MCRFVFTKKSQSINLDGEMYVAEVESFTHKCRNHVIVSQKFLTPEDHVLIIDGFLANGCALPGIDPDRSVRRRDSRRNRIAIERAFSREKDHPQPRFSAESLAIVDGMDAAAGTSDVSQPGREQKEAGQPAEKCEQCRSATLD